MKLKIKKESLYNYAEPVSFSPHHVRIFPRVDLFVKVERVVFETAPGADVQYRQDLFDNLIAYCFYPKTGLELPFRLELDLEVKEKNPFHFLLESTGFKIPPEYRPDRAEILDPYLRPEGGCKLPDPLAPTVPRPTVETLVNFNHWIYENIAYGPKIHGLAEKKADLDVIVERSLTRAGLWDEVKDRLEDSGTALSGGQQQRLCIARAIAVDPEVILMDEPASALDPIATAKIEELIDELSGRYAIVIVTHSMQQAARVSQRTAFFHLGTMVEYGETSDIFTNPREVRTKDYITGRYG